jgi:hypothetical protein
LRRLPLLLLLLLLMMMNWLGRVLLVLLLRVMHRM